VRIDQFITGTAADQILDAMVLAGADGAILDANPQALATYGYDLDRMRGLNLSDLRMPVGAGGAEYAAPEPGTTAEERHRRSDGTAFSAEIRWTPVAAGEEPGVLISVRDTSGRGRTRCPLPLDGNRLAAVFDNVEVGFVLTDADGSDVTMNVAALDLFEYASAEEMRSKTAAGQSDWELLCPDGRVMTEDEVPLNRAIGGEVVHGVEVRYRNTVTGTRWDAEVDVVPVRDEAGETTLIVQTLRDVSASRELNETRQNMAAAIIDVVGNVSEMRDPYTAGHQRRVAEVASAIAVEMGLPDVEIADIRIAGLMHDIGKMSVPAGILTKPSALSSIELNLVKEHSEAGYSMIAAAQMHEPIAELVYQHHERCDGSGYPRGLKADQLLLGSKVLMVADVVEAMMSHRSYRESLGQEAALAEIEQGAGRLYDTRVTEACLRLFREQGFAFSES